MKRKMFFQPSDTANPLGITSLNPTGSLAVGLLFPKMTSATASKLKGVERTDDRLHLLVDTLGFPILVRVTAASVQDRDGARMLLPDLRHGFFRLRCIWADKGYRGPLIAWVHQLRRRCRLFLDIVQGKKGKGFHVQPKRWIVE
jgi:hypothetical protein